MDKILRSYSDQTTTPMTHRCTHRVFRYGMPVNALLAMLVMALLLSSLHAITCHRCGRQIVEKFYTHP